MRRLTLLGLLATTIAFLFLGTSGAVSASHRTIQPLVVSNGLDAPSSEELASVVTQAELLATIGRVESAALPAPGKSRGRYRMTYYWVASESDETTPAEKRKPATRKLRDPSCRPLATVSRKFASRLRLEGTGRLEDGRLLNSTRRCKCGRQCFQVVDESTPWGLGVRNRPLEPYRSIAVDRRRFPIGSWLYIPELDGLTMPALTDGEPFIHDGCVVADDVGGGVRGRHIDLFTGERSVYQAFPNRPGLRKIRVLDGAARCAASRSRQLLRGVLLSSVEALNDIRALQK